MRIPHLLIYGFILCLLVSCSDVEVNETEQDFLWLEDVESERSTNWVDPQNVKTITQLTSNDRYRKSQKKILDSYNSPAKLRWYTYIGDQIRYVERGSANPRGRLLTMTVDESKKSDSQWTELVDFDLLSKTEGEVLVANRSTCNPYNPKQCLLEVSLNGADRATFREINLEKGGFVENGFFIPLGVTDVSWIDSNQVLLTSTYNDENLSKAGYGLTAKILKRGTTFESAEVIFSANGGDSVYPETHFSKGKAHAFFVYSKSLEEKELHYVVGKKTIKLNVPARVNLMGVHNDFVLLRLREDWSIGEHHYKTGSLVGVSLDSLTSESYETELVFSPAPNQILNKVFTAKSAIVLKVLEDVLPKIATITHSKSSDGDNRWDFKYLTRPTETGARILATSSLNDHVIAMYRGFINPSNIYLMNVADDTHRVLEKSPIAFDNSNLSEETLYATAPDGAKIPYQVVGPKK